MALPAEEAVAIAFRFFLSRWPSSPTARIAPQRRVGLGFWSINKPINVVLCTFLLFLVCCCWLLSSFRFFQVFRKKNRVQFMTRPTFSLSGLMNVGGANIFLGATLSRRKNKMCELTTHIPSHPFWSFALCKI